MHVSIEIYSHQFVKHSIFISHFFF